MSDPDDSGLLTLHPSEVRRRTFLPRVYGWMAAGLGLTGAVAILVSLPGNFEALAPMFPVLLILELVIVIGLSAVAHKLSVAACMAAFVGYSAINGATLSVLLRVYTAESVTATFFVTGGSFAALSLWAMTTKQDLSSWRSILYLALIGLLLATVVNIFLASSALYWALTYAGVVLFAALTAYDTQKLMGLEESCSDDSDASKKIAILAALTLYLDFVNLFIYLLRITGRRR